MIEKLYLKILGVCVAEVCDADVGGGEDGDDEGEDSGYRSCYGEWGVVLIRIGHNGCDGVW